MDDFDPESPFEEYYQESEDNMSEYEFICNVAETGEANEDHLNLFNQTWYTDLSVNENQAQVGTQFQKLIEVLRQLDFTQASKDKLEQHEKEVALDFQQFQAKLDETERPEKDAPIIRFEIPKWTVEEVFAYNSTEKESFQRIYRPQSSGKGIFIDTRPSKPAETADRKEEKDDEGTILVHERKAAKQIISGKPLQATGPRDLQAESNCIVKFENGQIDYITSLTQFESISNMSGYNEKYIRPWLEILCKIKNPLGFEPYRDEKDVNEIAKDIINLHWRPICADQSEALKLFCREADEGVQNAISRLKSILRCHFHYMSEDEKDMKIKEELKKAILVLVHPIIRKVISENRTNSNYNKKYHKLNWDIAYAERSEAHNLSLRPRKKLRLRADMEGLHVNMVAINELEVFPVQITSPQKRKDDLQQTSNQAGNNTRGENNRSPPKKLRRQIKPTEVKMDATTTGGEPRQPMRAGTPIRTPQKPMNRGKGIDLNTRSDGSPLIKPSTLDGSPFLRRTSNERRNESPQNQSREYFQSPERSGINRRQQSPNPDIRNFLIKNKERNDRELNDFLTNQQGTSKEKREEPLIRDPNNPKNQNYQRREDAKNFDLQPRSPSRDGNQSRQSSNTNRQNNYQNQNDKDRSRYDNWSRRNSSVYRGIPPGESNYKNKPQENYDDNNSRWRSPSSNRFSQSPRNNWRSENNRQQSNSPRGNNMRKSSSEVNRQKWIRNGTKSPDSRIRPDASFIPRGRSRSNGQTDEQKIRSICALMSTDNLKFWETRFCRKCNTRGHKSTLCPFMICQRCNLPGEHLTRDHCRLVALSIGKLLTMADTGPKGQNTEVQYAELVGEAKELEYIPDRNSTQKN